MYITNKSGHQSESSRLIPKIITPSETRSLKLLQRTILVNYIRVPSARQVDEIYAFRREIQQFQRLESFKAFHESLQE